jgi:hypothetical protein
MKFLRQTIKPNSDVVVEVKVVTLKDLRAIRFGGSPCRTVLIHLHRGKSIQLYISSPDDWASSNATLQPLRPLALACIIH